MHSPAAPNVPMRVHSFAPVVDAASRVLVLGSMPGVASLRAGQYYAHPRNLFWPLMQELLEVDARAPYDVRLAALLTRGVALWDVLRSCTRKSSLDADIVASSAVPNDFAGLLADHPAIRSICFNGRAAEAAFRRRVLPGLPDAAALALHALPSTSPANAGIPWTRKRSDWAVVARAARRLRTAP